jgi:hypothetical protein
LYTTLCILEEVTGTEVLLFLGLLARLRTKLLLTNKKKEVSHCNNNERNDWPNCGKNTIGIYYLDPDQNLIRMDPKHWPIDNDLDILRMNITSGWRKRSTGNRTAT